MTYSEAKKIASYMIKRANRLARRGVRMDSIDSRFDASARLAYGIAKGMGIDTEGMKPQEVWEAIRKEGGIGKAAKNKVGNGATAKRGTVVAQGYTHAETKKFLKGSRKISKSNYDKAGEIAKEEKNSSLWTYTSHGQDHVDQVIEKTNQAIDALEKIPSSYDLPIGKVDRKLLLVTAQFHDTGMDGGDIDYPDGNKLRKAHAANSAIHVLERANELEKMGVNPSKAALLAFAHTKSMSGIQDLANAGDWEVALERIEKNVSEYNERHPDKKINFKREDVFEGGKPDKKNIAEMATATAALRLGDANREANIPLRSQTGGEYKIDKMPPRGCANKEEEIAKSVISITDSDGRHELSADDPKMSKAAGFEFSKGVVLGERNMTKVDAEFRESDETLREVVTLRNGNDVPYSTAEALAERMGELNTINGVPRGMKLKMTGVKNWNELDDSAKKAYTDLWEGKDGSGRTGIKNTMQGINDLVLEFEDGTRKRFKK